jgi:hypothetical protein
MLQTNGGAKTNVGELIEQLRMMRDKHEELQDAGYLGIVGERVQVDGKTLIKIARYLYGDDPGTMRLKVEVLAITPDGIHVVLFGNGVNFTAVLN